MALRGHGRNMEVSFPHSKDGLLLVQVLLPFLDQLLCSQFKHVWCSQVSVFLKFCSCSLLVSSVRPVNQLPVSRCFTSHLQLSLYLSGRGYSYRTLASRLRNNWTIFVKIGTFHQSSPLFPPLLLPPFTFYSLCLLFLNPPLVISPSSSSSPSSPSSPSSSTVPFLCLVVLFHLPFPPPPLFLLSYSSTSSSSSSVSSPPSSFSSSINWRHRPAGESLSELLNPNLQTRFKHLCGLWLRARVWSPLPPGTSSSSSSLHLP